MPKIFNLVKRNYPSAIKHVPQMFFGGWVTDKGFIIVHDREILLIVGGGDGKELIAHSNARSAKVRANNEPALRFYLNNGWEMFGKKTRRILGDVYLIKTI